MHLLIILALLVWTLVGLWLLLRMWRISAAERRERRELRRADKAKRRPLLAWRLKVIRRIETMDDASVLVCCLGVMAGVMLGFWRLGVVG